MNGLLKRLTMYLTVFCISTAIASGSLPEVYADDVEYDLIESPVPEKILVLGDSIATGYGLEGYGEGKAGVESYANLLKEDFADELPAGEETLTNMAMDGQTSAQLLSGLENGDYDEQLGACDIVLISIGGNDLLHAVYDYVSVNGVGGKTFKDIFSDLSLAELGELFTGLNGSIDENIAGCGENLAKIKEYIRSKTEAPIIMQTVYDPFDNTDRAKLLKSFVKGKITALNSEIIKNSASEDGSESYTVADVYSDFSGQGKELTNINEFDIHPNADGHKKIYELLNQKIREGTYTVEIEKPKAAQADIITAPDEPETAEKKTSGTISTALCIIGGAIILATAALKIAVKIRSKKQ